MCRGLVAMVYMGRQWSKGQEKNEWMYEHSSRVGCIRVSPKNGCK